MDKYPHIFCTTFGDGRYHTTSEFAIDSDGISAIEYAPVAIHKRESTYTVRRIPLEASGEQKRQVPKK